MGTDLSQSSAQFAASIVQAKETESLHRSQSYRADQLSPPPAKRWLRKARRAYAGAGMVETTQDRIFSFLSLLILLSVALVVMVVMARFQPSSPFERYEIFQWEGMPTLAP